ncbi:MAG: nitrate reductase subunit beta [Candidatus Dormibacteria bacterium]|jgi:nitrate reductase beta subunit
MRIRAQVAMVMNLDKCLGCHTCSVTCKNVWTNRAGAEYIWFNDVETKPGIGYPKKWEDNQHWRGGWTLTRTGRLKLKAGGRLWKLLSLFANPDLPQIDDYYEPWTYDYLTLTNAPRSRHQPVARPHSQLSGRPMEIKWGPNWEDDLAGSTVTAGSDPNWQNVEEGVRLDYERAFMMYLPRICEHCLNPSCVASCPSGAMYKREEDGIVLVDQDMCRGWRFCVSGCPYKKVYFNHVTGKAEKCTFCYPRIEDGQPTICSETCVGRLRYLGLVLYDSDGVRQAASVRDPKDLLRSQRSLFLDPEDPVVREQARRDGVPDDWVEAARRSPVYTLAVRFQVALPLHPEYRTLPMVWYVPPLSPVLHAVGSDDGADPDAVFAAVEQMRIPVRYLSNLLAAGDDEVVRAVLRKLTAMRVHMRGKEFGSGADSGVAGSVGMSAAEIEEMYRLLAIAPYAERYVIPAAHREVATRLEDHGGCPVGEHGYPRSASTPASRAETAAHFMLGTEPKGALPSVRRTAHGFEGGLQLTINPPAVSGQ